MRTQHSDFRLDWGVILVSWLNFVIRAGFGCGALVAVSAASAESIQVRGVYAAQADLPADVELILMERFRGDLGQDVELALTDVLGGVFIRGEPYFDLIRPGASRGSRGGQVKVKGQAATTHNRSQRADADMRGTVRSEIIDRDVEPRIKRECVRRDGDGDCTERRDVRIECRELTVQVDPRILLIAADGQQIYSNSTPRTQSDRYCADDDNVPSGLAMVNGMIDELVDEIRRDLAPTESERNIRVMESRSNLRREDRDAFRAAVRATQTDVNGACDGFEALEVSNPDQVSVLFNIGLCFESSANLNLAADYYQRALVADPGRNYPTQGINRISDRQRAEAHLAQREQY